MSGGWRGFASRLRIPMVSARRMLSALALGGSTISELLERAVEPTWARPVLMHLLWSGEVLVDVTEPIGEASRVWSPADGAA
jgi:hypothetical protein